MKRARGGHATGPGARAVFLDRDGTVNAPVHHARRARELKLLPQSAAGIRRLRRAGWKIILITNQSVVARGCITEAELRDLHAFLQGQLRRAGAEFDAVYYCPHHPEGTVLRYRKTCRCRKPGAGLLRRAARQLGLDLRRSVMVGDAASDILAGKAAGCATVLVRTGNYLEALGTGVQPDFCAAHLGKAADWILKKMRPKSVPLLTPKTSNLEKPRPGKIERFRRTRVSGSPGAV